MTEEEDKKMIADRCPTCNRLLKTYKYKFSKQMAFSLIQLYKSTKNHTEGWIHGTTFFERWSKTKVRHWEYLRYWGLIERKLDQPADSNPSGVGYYRITEKGIDFLKGNIKIPQKCKYSLREVVGFEGAEISINEGYDEPFNFEEFYADSESRAV